MASTTKGIEGLPAKYNKHSATNGVNLFSTAFDAESSDDEWWNDDSASDEPKEKGSTKTKLTQFPIPPTSTGATRRPTMRNSKHRPLKTYSVRKLTRDKSKGRQRKQNAKAGIKVVTNFSRLQGATRQVPGQPVRKEGCFVDLATLQALDAKATHPGGGFWTSLKAQEPTRDLGSQSSALQHPGQLSKSPLDPSAWMGPLAKHQVKNLAVSPVNVLDDLSPSDRPIVIGISIPSTDMVDRALSPQTAASEATKIIRSYEYRSPTQTPETPSITITPAEEVSAWSALDPGATYSAPPIPQVPAKILDGERQRMAAEKSCFSPDSDDGTIWEGADSKIEHAPSRPCTVYSCTDFEDDESPVRGAHDSSTPIDDQSAKHLSISTVGTRHRSKGWWNYITTPFLTRSNTRAHWEDENQQVPAIPSLAIAAAKAQDVGRQEKAWEKQFSPLTPETATTISSEQWWVRTPTEERSGKTIGPDQKAPSTQPKHVAQPSSSTLPFVLLADTGLGLRNVSGEEHTIDDFKVSQGGSKPLDTQTPIVNYDREINSQDLQRNNSPRGPEFNDLHAPLPSIPLPVAAESRQPVRSGAFRVPPKPSAVATPPPPYSPPPGGYPRYQAILPPGHPSNSGQPMSPGPLTPGLAQTMTSQGAIPLSNVPLAASARRPINLNSGYPIAPTSVNNIASTVEDLGREARMARKIEAKRQRHEKEDAVARRAGGWWRGRGCIPKRGCYGRSGAEGRKRRRWYIVLTFGFISLIILIVILATTLHRKSSTITSPSQWLNLTGFPPIFVGLSTVAVPINVVSNTGCVFPATQWSCDLPKELQTTVDPSRPNFLLNIQWDNSSSANASFAKILGNPRLGTRGAAGKPVSAGQLAKRILVKAQEIVTFVPSPAPPAFKEEVFLGNTTDGIVASDKAGEPTPFYISFLATTKSSSSTSRVTARSASILANPFPNVTEIIPPPTLNSDGTAAPANLLPLPAQQPIRLYDRGLPTEHYGFYTYFDRSIFLKSLSPLNGSNAIDGEVPDDRNGGSTQSEANFRCTWAQTRFLVQMWTRMGSSAQLLNGTSTTQPLNATTFQQPGSFPYPITITTDRHGGDPALKMLYCYEMNEREGIVASSGQINAENRGFGGTLINRAPSVFANSSDPALGGFDGGTGGCSCQWQNFQKVGHT